MIKVSVMYPNGPESRFDDAYYCERHMPLVKERMGDALLYYTVDRALAAGKSDPNAPYIAMGHLFCESQETFQAGFGPHTKEIMDDIQHFTNQKPVMQFSEVLVGHEG
ncbi:EthD family reductase [Massilia sp. 9096]|uniref:EthD family reductase n=1 Tax=Massilia sp. 9096 TaxID=1500894 RepID=UPI00056152DA|nr:EthD family reductase [Massilia sp. 9096]